MIPADGQLAGTPSTMFDAVALVLSTTGAKMLAKESCAVDFVRDAFGHLKALAVDAGGRELLSATRVEADIGVVEVGRPTEFLAAAMTRQWEREPNVRTLA